MKKIIIPIIVVLLLYTEAYAFGIAPTRKEIFFEKGQHNFSFRLINPERDQINAEITVKGVLAKNIYLEDKSFVTNAPEKEIKYSLNLEDNNLPPGKNIVEFIVSPIEETKNRIQAQMGLKHKLIVFIPYPDEYVEGQLFTTVDEEEVTFTLALSSLGEKETDVKARFEVYQNNTMVAELTPESIHLKSQEQTKIFSNYRPEYPGAYQVKAIISYADRETELIQIFAFGKPMIEIEEIQSGSFKLGTVAKLDVILKSNWNDLIEDVEVNTIIKNSDISSQLDIVKRSLGPNERSTATFFWDTKGISLGTYEIVLQIKYNEFTDIHVYYIAIKEDELIVGKTPPIITADVIKTEPPKTKIYLLWIPTIILIIMAIISFARLKKERPIKQEDNPRDRLEKYLRKKIKEGHDINRIKKKLISIGWPEELVEEAVSKIENASDRN